MVDELKSMMTAEAGRRGLVFEVEEEFREDNLIGDVVRLKQVMMNLISNAVRFTVEGEITVTAKQRENALLVCVADNGAGVSRERMPYLFERYGGKTQSGGGRDTGSGLGLYICKYIVEEHGGTIWLESTAGLGTSVFFTLPVAAANSAPC
jgi:signal transduction histidine kinase